MNDTAKELGTCENWELLVGNIKNKQRDNYINLKGKSITNLIKALIEEFNNDSALIAKCKEKLEIYPQNEEDWTQVYAAAKILCKLADRNQSNWEDPVTETQIEDALWKAAETWGVNSFSDLGGTLVPTMGNTKSISTVWI